MISLTFVLFMEIKRNNEKKRNFLNNNINPVHVSSIEIKLFSSSSSFNHWKSFTIEIV
jgi:hypothetical protein